MEGYIQIQVVLGGKHEIKKERAIAIITMAILDFNQSKKVRLKI